MAQMSLIAIAVVDIAFGFHGHYASLLTSLMRDCSTHPPESARLPDINRLDCRPIGRLQCSPRDANPGETTGCYPAEQNDAHPISGRPMITVNGGAVQNDLRGAGMVASPDFPTRQTELAKLAEFRLHQRIVGNGDVLGPGRSVVVRGEMLHDHPAEMIDQLVLANIVQSSGELLGIFVRQPGLVEQRVISPGEKIIDGRADEDAILQNAVPQHAALP